MTDPREIARKIALGLPLDGSDPPPPPPRSTKRFGFGNKVGHKSGSLGVHPEQAKEFNEAARAAGNTGVHYDRAGVMHYDSRKDLRDESKRRGYFNKDGGYGDAMPDNL